MPSCPECASQKVWKDGFRRTRDGDVQRYLCRRCGYRFSGFKQNRVPQLQVKKYVTFQPFKKLHSRPYFTQIPIRHSDSATKKALNDSSFSMCEDVSPHNDAVKSTVGKTINKFLCNSGKRRVCASDGEAKNLVKVEPRTEKRAAGATKASIAETKGKIVEFAWWMKKQGYREASIRLAFNRLAVLVKRGANLLDPESVKEIIAKQPWAEATKHIASKIYTSFLKMRGLTWEPPIYKPIQKIPFIPTEKEIDALISGCGKKLSAFLQLAKETAARSGELQSLKWLDLDVERRTVRITAEKNSNPRIMNVSSRCLGMLQALPKKSEKIFGNIGYNSLRTGFGHQRRRIAKKLNNPRLNKIHFHTLRHWKATMLYHQTKDILHVMQFLGHKKVENTLRYVQLEQALFKDTSDEFTVRVANKPQEIKELLEAGFDFVCQKDDFMYFRKRK